MLKHACFTLLLLTGLANSAPAQHHFDHSPINNNKSAQWIKQGIQYKKDVPSDVDLLVSLDQQQYPALKKLIQQFAQQHQLNISVSDGTCGISAGLLSRKQADIGGFCCPPGAGDRLPGLRFHTLGIAALAMITHPDNPTDNVSFEQAQKLFSGEIESWNELPKITDARNVQAITRLHCKKRPGHWKLLLEDENFFSPMAMDMGAIPDVITHTHQTPGAIGYETLDMVQRYQGSEKVKILNVNNSSPHDLQALASGRYPLYRTYSITTWQGTAHNPLADKLVAYLIQQLESQTIEKNLLTPSKLRQAGWQFNGDELISAPPPPHSRH
ncbi:MAG: substrate-binding domain-containing protein [Gammaproteobacteria bacterium]|nr:substrate-binding domain-containing protein [Gammaproteobacteria bacterium]